MWSGLFVLYGGFEKKEVRFMGLSFIRNPPHIIRVRLQFQPQFFNKDLFQISNINSFLKEFLKESWLFCKWKSYLFWRSHIFQCVIDENSFNLYQGVEAINVSMKTKPCELICLCVFKSIQNWTETSLYWITKVITDLLLQIGLMIFDIP